MKFLETFDFFANLLSLVVIVLSVYVFLTDLFRRWLFLGYKPTAIVILKDIAKDNVLVIRRDVAHKVKRDYPWHFPQGGIYSSDINGAVNGILGREFRLEPHLYDFERTIVLGVKKIKQRKIYKKYHFGSFSLFPSLKGKGYISCVVYTDLKRIKRKIVLGHELKEVKIVSFENALKMIDPQKAQMLRKVAKQILE